MVLVYPLIRANEDNIELRYSLRSMSLAVPVTKVIIIGHLPAWVKNVIHVPFDDHKAPPYKEKNIFDKLCKAFETEDEFLFCNDDHFINDTFNPFFKYFDGKLIDLLLRAGNGYRQTIYNTIAEITNAYNFDVHCPIYMHKEKFIKAFIGTNFMLPYGFCVKSMYANNYLDMLCESCFDLKVKTPEGYETDYLRSRPFFSVSDAGFTPRFVAQLQELYPLKSLYE